MKKLILLTGSATVLAVAPATGQNTPVGQNPPAARPATAGQLPEGVTEQMRVQADDVDKVLANSNVVLLDVREPKELEEFGTRPGYVNIPLGQLEGRLDELPKDKTILTA